MRTVKTDYQKLENDRAVRQLIKVKPRTMIIDTIFNFTYCCHLPEEIYCTDLTLFLTSDYKICISIKPEDTYIIKAFLCN